MDSRTSALLSDIAHQVHGLLGRKGARVQFTDQVRKWYAELPSGPIELVCFSEEGQTLTLADKYALLAAIHDRDFRSAQINPWPDLYKDRAQRAAMERRKEEDDRSIQYSKKFLAYDVLKGSLSELGKQKTDGVLLQDFLQEVTADLDKHLGDVRETLPGTSLEAKPPTSTQPQDVAGAETPPRQPAYFFRRKGANFDVLFDGEAGSIPVELRGSWFIFWLLQSPNVSMSSTSLRQRHAIENGADVFMTNQRDDAADQPTGDGDGDTSDEIEYLEKQAVKLGNQIAEARKNKDQPKIDRLVIDLDWVRGDVKKLRGDDGKPRKQRGSDADRVAVTTAIKMVIAKCRTDWAMPHLSKHLDTIKTGAQVCYQAGEDPPAWVFS